MEAYVGASRCSSDTSESREGRQCPAYTAAFSVRAHHDQTQNLGLCWRAQMIIIYAIFNASMRPPRPELTVSFEVKSTTYAASMALHEAHHRHHHRHHRHQLVFVVVLVRLWTYALSAPERP